MSRGMCNIAAITHVRSICVRRTTARPSLRSVHYLSNKAMTHPWRRSGTKQPRRRFTDCIRDSTTFLVYERSLRCSTYAASTTVGLQQLALSRMKTTAAAESLRHTAAEPVDCRNDEHSFDCSADDDTKVALPSIISTSLFFSTIATLLWPPLLFRTIGSQCHQDRKCHFPGCRRCYIIQILRHRSSIANGLIRSLIASLSPRSL